MRAGYFVVELDHVRRHALVTRESIQVFCQLTVARANHGQLQPSDPDRVRIRSLYFAGIISVVSQTAIEVTVEHYPDLQALNVFGRIAISIIVADINYGTQEGGS